MDGKVDMITSEENERKKIEDRQNSEGNEECTKKWLEKWTDKNK